MSDGYTALAAAILLQAANDYNASCEVPGKLVYPLRRDVQEFARSQWCDCICELAGIDYARYRRRLGKVNVGEQHFMSFDGVCILCSMRGECHELGDA